MTKKLATLATLAVLVATTLVAPSASAGHRSGWHAGAGFRIGPFRFQIVLGSDDHGHHGHYYRTDSPFQYGERYSCSTRCFKHQDHYYHHPHCRGLLHHFDRHGVNPYENFDRYAPSYDDDGYDGSYEYEGSYRREYRRDDGYDDGWRSRRPSRRSCRPRYPY